VPSLVSELLKLAAAFGFGGFLIKILDIVWLQKVIQINERKKWLREQRLRVYAELSKELMALGRHYGTREDAFMAYSFIAEALLLVDDENLGKRLEQFFTHLSNLYKKLKMESPDVSEQELENAYAFILQNSRSLVIELRKSLQKV